MSRWIWSRGTRWRLNWYGDNGYSTLRYLFIFETPRSFIAFQVWRNPRPKLK